MRVRTACRNKLQNNTASWISYDRNLDGQMKINEVLDQTPLWSPARTVIVRFFAARGRPSAVFLQPTGSIWIVVGLTGRVGRITERVARLSALLYTCNAVQQDLSS